MPVCQRCHVAEVPGKSVVCLSCLDELVDDTVAQANKEQALAESWLRDGIPLEELKTSVKDSALIARIWRRRTFQGPHRQTRHRRPAKAIHCRPESAHPKSPCQIRTSGGQTKTRPETKRRRAAVPHRLQPSKVRADVWKDCPSGLERCVQRSSRPSPLQPGIETRISANPIGERQEITFSPTAIFSTPNLLARNKIYSNCCGWSERLNQHLIDVGS